MRYPCAALSAAKHDYVARGMAAHPRFELAVVADDPDVPEWTHQRNQALADQYHVPYVRDVERALRDFDVQVAIVSPEVERHHNLSVRAAAAGKHVVQDKPMATCVAEADRIVEAIDRAGVRFMMWNRNTFPAVVHTREQVKAGVVGELLAVHVDFYFAKDAGPPKRSRPAGQPLEWREHQIAAHADGSDGGLGNRPMGELQIEGIYPLAYIWSLTRAKVRRVFGRSTAHFHQLYVDSGVEDLASVTLELEGGVTASLAIGRIGAASHPSGGEIKIRVRGSEGAFVVAESRPEVGVYYRDQAAREARQRRVAGEYDLLLAERFARALDGDGLDEPLLDVHASRHIMATVEAALASCRTNQPAEVEA